MFNRQSNNKVIVSNIDSFSRNRRDYKNNIKIIFFNDQGLILKFEPRA